MNAASLYLQSQAVSIDAQARGCIYRARQPLTAHTHVLLQRATLCLQMEKKIWKKRRLGMQCLANNNKFSLKYFSAFNCNALRRSLSLVCTVSRSTNLGVGIADRISNLPSEPKAYHKGNKSHWRSYSSKVNKSQLTTFAGNYVLSIYWMSSIVLTITRFPLTPRGHSRVEILNTKFGSTSGKGTEIAVLTAEVMLQQEPDIYCK